MPDRHEAPSLPDPLVTETRGEELHVRLPEGQEVVFLLHAVPSLTRRTAAEIIDTTSGESGAGVFVFYRRATADARDALRAAGISFGGEDGRLFVRAPGILVDREVPAARETSLEWGVGADDEGSLRNPFAKKSSRVPRWFLLHHDQSFARTELAKAVELNHTAVSRVVRALEDAALVREVSSDVGGRRRDVRLEKPLGLLAAWLPHWERRRVRHRRWDIGAREVDEAVTLITESVGERLPWALGGLAGAAFVRRAVEPTDALVWVRQEDVASFASILQPEPARGGRGAIRIAVAPDEWTLGLATRLNEVPIADPVQLWLDCASEGERSLEAAEAVADRVGWS